MKKTSLYMVRLLACLLVLPGLLLAQDFPVNTESAGARAHFIKGLDALDANRGNDARTHFDTAIELDAGFAAAQLFRSFVATSGADWRTHNDAALANRADASPFIQNMIDRNIAGAANDSDKIMQLAKELVIMYPGSARAHTSLADEYAEDLDYTAERASNATAIAVDRRFAPAYEAMAVSYVFNEPKDYDKAEKYARKYMKLEADEASAYILVGDVHRAQSDFEKARDNYASAIEINPQHATAYSKKGHSHTFLGDYEAARADFDAAAKVTETLGGKAGQHNFGMYTHLYNGDADAAMAANAEVISMIETSGADESEITFALLNALWERGVMAMHAGDSKEASRAFKQRAEEVERAIPQVNRPAWEQNMRAGVVLWDAMALVHKGDTKKARKMAEEYKSMMEVRTDERRFEDYHRLVGLIEMKEGNGEAAVAHLEQADDQSPMVKFELASAHEAAGNTEGAMALYKEVANYNFNGLESALTRNAAKEKLSM